jgi:ABC-2 type transport system permease protein
MRGEAMILGSPAAGPAAGAPRHPVRGARDVRRLARIYRLEAESEVLKALRLPAYLVPLLAFPAMFYLLFGVSMHLAAVGGVPIAAYLLATYGAFGVMNAALFGFGIGIAAERGQGWLLLKRATPMPPLALFVGKLATSLLFSAVVVTILFALGIGFGHVRLAPATLAALAAVLVGGALPFAALGLALGYWAGPNSAPVVCNLVSLPVAFASGLWLPYPMLPPVMRQVAHGLPAYHFAQLALGVLGAGNREPVWWGVLYLAAFTALMLLLARFGYLRDEGRTYG